jgi:hypothetical protein
MVSLKYREYTLLVPIVFETTLPAKHIIFYITVILDALITTSLRTCTRGKLELETGKEPPDGKRKTHQT